MAGPGNLVIVSLVVALSSLLYMQWYPLLNQFGGRLSDLDPARYTVHIDHKPLNNDKCKKFPEGQACEDVRIHQDSSTAFLACGYPETRRYFYPPIRIVSTTAANSYREYFLKYDLETGKTTQLDVVGWDGDLVLHGIDIRVRPEDSSTIDLWAVNHDRKGESILLFSHVLGTKTLTFVKEFKHPLIKTPNAVAATGALSFFISNDNYAYPTTWFGIPRWFEKTFGPFSWASSIVHCLANPDGDPFCKIVSPPNSHPAANGVALVEDGKALLVNEIVEATTTVYDVHPVSKMLKLRKKINLGAPADNLQEIPGTGDVSVCVFPNPGALFGRLAEENILNSSMIGAAAVLRLRKDRDYEPEVIYWDDGSLITILTGAAVDPVRKKMIAGGVVERHFIVCDLEDVEF
ncbi:uncharacterized protein PV09_01989 [Verruconis gallopava]|uniref:SMP-30/Gluconolactonase/LRE-like region domain-containing protein n=1 Tax=Verruconis gallopava TaxID=253628 RepID=A0A0D2B795_9PEZI|nr:uncharacterized protein PV09_01989 [Verruconis gallopava]KIW07114.1 hypothetical protein PV09_01989 [Verruconis gallopava]